MTTFIDIHALQTLPPSNLNRDENGRPKTCIYGGTPRMRVSSQAWKKTIRDYFRTHINADKLGSRSREFVNMIATRTGLDPEDENLINVATILLSKNGLNISADNQRPGCSSALQFFGNPQWEQIATIAREAYESDDPTKIIKANRKTLRDQLAADKSLDIAMFGRMSASDDKNEISLNIDAACQFAHAISVNRANVETDFFTAVDDAEGTAGAGMVGETGFMSATMYRYACVDATHLLQNLGDDRDALYETIRTFLNGFVYTLPSGKTNAFAHQTLPAFLEVVIRTDRPINLVEAFEKPVTGDTIPEAVRLLLAQEETYQTMFALDDAPRFMMADMNAQRGLTNEQKTDLISFPELVNQVITTIRERA